MNRILVKKTLREFWETVGCEDSEQALKSWYHEAKQADWKTANDVKAQYKSASIVGNNKVVFNICGNKYRLIVKINYENGWVFVKFIGTHKEYDKIDVASL